MFSAPKGHKTHPMSEKARGAIFSILGDISGLRVLDAFSGSGALVIEALSRGADSAVAIDSDIDAFKVIKSNIDKLKLNKHIKVIRANTSSWSDNNQNTRFDLVLCDPPYNNLQINLLKKIVIHVKKDGLLVLSLPGNENIIEFDAFKVVKQKAYGDIRVVVYRSCEMTE